jgi:hypothetical protein
MNNRVVLQSSTPQLVTEIMQVEFVASWSYEQHYQDILHGFGQLITQLNFTDHGLASNMITQVV